MHAQGKTRGIWKRWGGREHVGKAVTNRRALGIKKLSCTKAAEAPLLAANQTL